MTTALAWLARPVSLLGLAVLLLNDHMLKQQWPGLITGKLSDIAGMLMFPPLLAVLVSLAAPRIRPGHLAVSSLLATAAGFSMVKSFPPVAALVSTDLIGPSLVRADLTDLVALPALWLSWRSFTHARPVRSALPGSSARRSSSRPGSSPRWRPVRTARPSRSPWMSRRSTAWSG